MRIKLIEERKTYQAVMETEAEKDAFEMGYIDACRDISGDRNIIKALSFVFRRITDKYLTDEQQEVFNTWAKENSP